ncbi:Homeobox-DDT domain protein RLT3 [Linum perenne]
MRSSSSSSSSICLPELGLHLFRLFTATVWFLELVNTDTVFSSYNVVALCYGESGSGLIDEKYPSTGDMEGLAEDLDLTLSQVRVWFVEKRRREKSKIHVSTPLRSKKLPIAGEENQTVIASSAGKALRQRRALSHDMSKSSSSLSSEVENGIFERSLVRVQKLLPSEYIMSKVFRKDGPVLGVEFDSVPSRGFHTVEDSRNSLSASEDDEAAKKKRKHVQDCTLSEMVKKHGMGKGLMTKNVKDYCNGVSTVKHGIGKGLMRKCHLLASENVQDCSTSVSMKNHGMGKGLMTVWQATNLNDGDISSDIHLSDGQRTSTPEMASPESIELQQQKRKRQSVMVGSKGEETEKQLIREKCELGLDEKIAQQPLTQFEPLMDDEEVEIRELHAGPNPLSCSEHCSDNGLHSCSLCKDLLPKFPPVSVNMKQPFAVQPWESSSEAVKKFFKVLHFLYTYSVTTKICSFTLDALAQAFHDKDSLLLGEIHVALLKLLLHDVETEMRNGLLSHLTISCKFLALLHCVEGQELLVDFWKSSLNPLTWTEILRQVLVAAGLGSKQGAFRRQALSKEMRIMLKYGLIPGTLKAELFKLVFQKGNHGVKISELAKSTEVAELNLANTTEERELLISSTLSSDITLFEKISLSAYRLRISSLMKDDDKFQSDSEDSGSIHDDLNDAGTCSSSDSECETESSSQRKLRHPKCSKSNMFKMHNEIDESHPGEAWLLGLMDGEYSDLSIEERLNVLVALIDLVSAGSSIRMEDPVRPAFGTAPNLQRFGSGAKIKRSSLHRPSWVHGKQNFDPKVTSSSSKSQPVDSSVAIFKFNAEDKSSSTGTDAKETQPGASLHHMQSLFLGSDRRYNRYWLFLGPCDFHDPGHKRVYFESSEDGHWKVIDTAEALHSLLSVLDNRGRREAHLIASLEKRETYLCQEMSSALGNDAARHHLSQSSQSELTVREDSSSPVSDVDNALSLMEITNGSLPQCSAIVLDADRNLEEQNPRQSHLQQFDAWIWNHFYCDLNAVKHNKKSYFESLSRCQTCHDLYWKDEKHCRICHTTFEVDFDLEEKYAVHTATCRLKVENEKLPQYKVLPSILQTLKASVHAIELAMPEGALVGAWTKSAHRLWVKRLRRTSSLSELLQVVTDFVAAINEDWLCQYNDAPGFNPFAEEIVACFSSMPQTSSALALWLVKLDDLILQHLENAQCKENHETAEVIR